MAGLGEVSVSGRDTRLLGERFLSARVERAASESMTEPRLSVVCFGSPHRERTTRCLAALGAQTAADSIELIRRRDAAGSARPPATVATVVLQLAAALLGQARAMGLRAASAPAIAFMSDHCRPGARVGGRADPGIR